MVHLEDNMNINEDIEYYSYLVDALGYASEDNSEQLSILLEPIFKANTSELEACLIYQKAMLINSNKKFFINNHEKEYEKLLKLSAKGKCKEGQYLVANRLYEKKHYQEAIQLYKESALQGYAPSQWCYGIDLFRGIEGALKRNEVLGLKYIQYSAGQLYEYAVEFLVESYTNGNGIIVKNKEKSEYYSRMLDWL